MDYFNYKNDTLFAENIAVDLIAKKYGTPCYIYSKATFERHWHAFNDALGSQPHLICYAVKANSNLAILNLLAKLGSGFDVVSLGELYRVKKAGGDMGKTVFSGVGKTRAEIEAAIDEKILCLNVESVAELERIEEIAAHKQCQVPISLRINPDIDALTHPYISTGLKDNKFGIAFNKARQLYLSRKQYPNLLFKGLDCHIGSQLTQLSPFLDALDKCLSLCDELKANGLEIEHLDLGGGLGVTYHDEQPPLPSELASAVKEKLAGRALQVILEPGRAIAANAGILITQVEYLKTHHDKSFAIVDAAMNDLLRPSLYQAYQTIIPVIKKEQLKPSVYDIVGPVCETGDFLGKERLLSLDEGALLAVRGSGAYGFSMSSNYNSRPKVAEILVDQDKAHLIRRRETLDCLIEHEIIPT